MLDNPTVVAALEVVGRVLRSWWTLVAGLSLGLTGAIVALDFTPKIYEAGARIYVASPIISKDMVESTVTEDLSTRMMAMEEVLLSRPYMVELIDRVFTLPESQAAQERLMYSLRSKTDVDFNSRERTFTLTFEDRDPYTAADVVNALVEVFIEKNGEVRANIAEETTDTLEELAADAREKLMEKEEEISRYEEGHLHELPERLNANMKLLESKRQELSDLIAEIEDHERELEILEERHRSAELFAETGTTDEPAESPAARLQRLQSELEQLRVHYSERHPDVVAKVREVERARQQLGREGPEGEGPRPMRTPLEVEIEAERRTIDKLGNRREELRAEIREYERRIDATPEVARALAGLRKGYEVYKNRFDELQERLGKAKDAEKVEARHRGTQFEILYRAVPPAIPIKPVPARFYGMGVAIGLLAFLGPPVLGVLLVPRVNSERGLRQSLERDVPVLVAVPTLPTPTSLRQRRWRTFVNFSLSLIAVAALAATWLTLGWGAP